MTRRTLFAIIVLFVIAGAVILIVNRRHKKQEAGASILSVSAFNQSKNAEAIKQAAKPGDVIVYTLNAENPSSQVITGYVLEVNIQDISELATLSDAQGANYNVATDSLIWTPLDIPANGSIEKKFTVKVKNDLPQNSDLVMTIKFNNQLDISVARVAVAGVVTGNPDQTPAQGYKAPTTGPSGLLVILPALFTTLAVFLYHKSKKLI